MNNYSRESIELSYLILQNKYLSFINNGRLSEGEILSKFNDFFPENWMLKYSIEDRIKLLGTAIKEKKNLIEIVEKSTVSYKK